MCSMMRMHAYKRFYRLMCRIWYSMSDAVVAARPVLLGSPECRASPVRLTAAAEVAWGGGGGKVLGRAGPTFGTSQPSRAIRRVHFSGVDKYASTLETCTAARLVHGVVRHWVHSTAGVGAFWDGDGGNVCGTRYALGPVFTGLICVCWVSGICVPMRVCVFVCRLVFVLLLTTSKRFRQTCAGERERKWMSATHVRTLKKANTSSKKQPAVEPIRTVAQSVRMFIFSQ